MPRPTLSPYRVMTPSLLQEFRVRWSIPTARGGFFNTLTNDTNKIEIEKWITTVYTPALLDAISKEIEDKERDRYDFGDNKGDGLRAAGFNFGLRTALEILEAFKESDRV